MPISDADFDSTLDAIVDSTRGAVGDRQASDYHTTVFLVRDGEIAVQVLSSGESLGFWRTLMRFIRRRVLARGGARVGDEPVDTYDLLYELGRHQGKDHSCPDAVFVGAEGVVADGSESIVLVGYTPDGRANTALLALERAADNTMRIMDAEVHHFSDGRALEWRRNGAQEVLRGFLEAAANRNESGEEADR